jgi:DNA-binding GntR family transcriptional regulator
MMSKAITRLSRARARRAGTRSSRLAPPTALPAALAVSPRASTPRLIADELRRAIVDGTLAPGARLRQDALADRFRVSAIPVREALRQLESEGWIAVETHKGATVTALSADEAREIYEMRAALERLAIGLAIPCHTERTLAECAALCRAAAAERDPALYVSRNEAFHLGLYAPAARPRLFALLAALHRRGERYLRLKLVLPPHKRRSDREHAALLEAVRARQVERAQTLVAEHLVGTGELLYRFMTEAPPAKKGR